MSFGDQLQRFGLAEDYEAYKASPVPHVVGLTVNAGIAYLAYYLMKHKHPVWGALFAASALGGAAFNVYSLTRPK